MNSLERKMVDALVDLKENHQVAGIKAEFEAEGTRMEEALRLKEVCARAGLGLTIKIGGCEALRDMYECRVIGVERIVGPMIESVYALQKFLAASKLAFPEDERQDVQFAINVETGTACAAFDEMVAVPDIAGLSTVVLGRVDLTGSLGMSRDSINSEEILELTRKVFRTAKRHNIECTVGGGVSAHSLPFFRNLAQEGLIDRYETRKVIFDCPAALKSEPEKGILKAVGFELLWLKNKRDYYSLIANEDAHRIKMLESRYKALIEEAGGTYE